MGRISQTVVKSAIVIGAVEYSHRISIFCFFFFCKNKEHVSKLQGLPLCLWGKYSSVELTYLTLGFILCYYNLHNPYVIFNLLCLHIVFTSCFG